MNTTTGRAIILVMDSFGIGATDDAGDFGDVGSNTLGSIASHRAAGGNPLKLPNLTRLGLMDAAQESSGARPEGCDDGGNISGAYGYAAELSTGKDTPSGHWEIAGVPVLFDWGYFTEHSETFPPELLDSLIERASLPGVLGNCHASGGLRARRRPVRQLLRGRRDAPGLGSQPPRHRPRESGV